MPSRQDSARTAIFATSVHSEALSKGSERLKFSQIIAMLEVGLHYNIGSLICEIVPEGASLGFNVLGVPIQCQNVLAFCAVAS